MPTNISGTNGIDKIQDGTIVDADVNASAAIGGSKIDGSFGKVLQVVSTTKTDTFSTSSNTFVDITGLTVSITPSSTSSKILVLFGINKGNNGAGAHNIRMMRDSTPIGVGDAAGSRNRASVSGYMGASDADAHAQPMSMQVLDAPASTSAITYKLQMETQDGHTGYINRNARDTDSDSNIARTASTITVMEIAG